MYKDHFGSSFEAYKYLGAETTVEGILAELNISQKTYITAVSGTWYIGVPAGLSLDETLYEILPEDTEAADALIAAAKEARNEAVYAVIEVLDVTWDVDRESLGKINDAVAYATRAGIADDTAQGWILADNTIRQTTVAELKDVLNAHAQRMEDVYAQYTTWIEGDIAEAFEYVEEEEE